MVKRRRWSSIEGAVEYASMSDKSIRRLIAAGKLTAYQPTNKILVDLDQLDALIAATAGASAGNRGDHLHAEVRNA